MYYKLAQVKKKIVGKNTQNCVHYLTGYLGGKLLSLVTISLIPNKSI